MEKRVCVNYRNEFYCHIMASGNNMQELVQDAIKKFQSGDYKIKIIGCEEPDLFKVFDVFTNEELKT